MGLCLGGSGCGQAYGCGCSCGWVYSYSDGYGYGSRAGVDVRGARVPHARRWCSRVGPRTSIS